MRTTKQEVKGMFKRLVKAMGKKEAEGISSFSLEANPFLGSLRLDYAPIYGGYVIEEEMEGGGVNHPFGSTRRSAREMYLSMLMTAQALEDIRYRQELLNKYEIV